MNTQAGQDEDDRNRRLQRRLQILKKMLEEGRIKFAKDLKVIESLTQVHYAPDGSVDLNTVDASVRALALAVEYQHDREELKKKNNLAEIQSVYFEFLHNNFGMFYEAMVKRDLTPHDAGMTASNNPEAIKELTSNLQGFLDTIKEFWSQCGDAATAHVEDMSKSLKGVFGGDLFPSALENIASKCGVYTDTIILPDPFIRSLDLFPRWTPKQQAYYLIKHALNLLKYRDLACADVTPPIVVILPETSIYSTSEREFFMELGVKDALVHAGKVYGRRFESINELVEFSNKLDTIEKVVAASVDQSRILFDTEWDRSASAQLHKATNDVHAQLVGTTHPGLILAHQFVGRFSVINELLAKAERLRGTPIVDAPTSWQYFVWKLEYDSSVSEKALSLPDLHVLKALDSLKGRALRWLGRVPPQALIEIRKSSAVPELREILKEGVTQLSEAAPMDFHATGHRVFSNLESALLDHEQKVEELSAKKWKFAGVDIGSLLVTGSLAVTAAITASAEATIAAFAADQILDPPKLRDIPAAIRDLKRESKDLKKSPVGMLFKYRE